MLNCANQCIDGNQVLGHLKMRYEEIDWKRVVGFTRGPHGETHIHFASGVPEPVEYGDEKDAKAWSAWSLSWRRDGCEPEALGSGEDSSADLVRAPQDQAGGG